ncbi:hypothetical protein Tco_0400898, partial [Tanacetum coccineum]
LKRLYKVGLTTRVESSDNEESLGEDASKQVRIDAIDTDEEITLVSVHDVNVSAGEEVAAGDIVSAASAATTVSAATATTATIKTINDITLSQALEEMKSTKPKKKRVIIQELGKSTTTISSQQSQEKGKEILIEPVKPMNKKDQIRLDEETALNLQVKFDEEERLAREKAEKEEEANIALIETWDDIQAKIDDVHQLAKRMQAQEQEELSIEEKATLFQQLLEKRRKHFAAKRAEEKRNKPPTKAQQRKIMCSYLKNMEGYKLKDLKLKEFDSIQEMFDRAFKKVNTFEDFRTELVEGKKKRAGTELIQEITKKQKGDLKTMFEPHVEDKVWRNQQEYKVLNWKLYDSYGVHSLMMQSMKIYMLVEKKYPLTPPTLSMMLEKKLIIHYESEMAYQLLKFIMKQLKK